MRVRVLTSALIAVVLSACNGDGRITEPQPRVPAKLTPLAAIGTDPATGATIETNFDDYVPGQVIHLVGRGWAPNETVHLLMTESPDTHEDVARDVQADGTGAFSLDFYDVQPHDLGVTFTLTASGSTSNSRAVATFTDGNFAMRAAFTPSGGPSFTGTLLKFAQSTVCDPASSGQTTVNTPAVTTAAGPQAGVNTDNSARLTVPASVPGYVFDGWTVSGAVTLQAGSSLSDISICVRGTETGSAGARTFTANYVAVANTTPVVTAGDDASINEGATFSRNGSFSDPDADSWTATVNYGDGGGDQSLALVLPAKTFSLSHVYADNGTYNVTVSVNDGTASGSDVIVVTVANVPPDVNAGTDATIAGGTAFNQGGSFTDPGADTWTATVNYGDGSGVQALALSGKNFTLNHTYAASGSYTVTVVVTDDDGGTDSDQVTVNVGNNAPVVSAGNDATLNEGGTFNQNGSFTDPDADTWTATVNYGDGTGDQALTLVGKTFTLNHVYADNAVYTVTVTVTDNHNGSDSDDVSVTVNNVPPVVNPVANADINEGDTFSQAGSFTDPGADVWTATVDYGDGSGPQALTLGAGKTFNLNHTYTDNGNFTVVVTVTDDDGGSDTEEALIQVANVPPVVSAGVDASINEGATFTRNGSFTDPGADTWTATVNYGDGSGTQALTLGAGKTFALNHTYTDNGIFTITVAVTDDDGATGTDVVQLTVNNVDPVVSAGNDATISEGGTFSQAGSFTDPGADTWTATVNYGDGTGTHALTLGAGKTFNLSHLYADDDGGPFTVTVTVTDDDSGSDTDIVIVTVNNMNPAITAPINVPLAPIPVGSPVSVTWTFTDPGADTWQCKISWDQPISFGGLFASAAGGTGKSCTASTSALPAGIYTVTVYVEDDDGGSDQETATAYIVVYDPSAGFVTGGGWINSPLGAFVAEPTLIGKANFGFVSKYKKGQTVPDGNTEFQFHAGNLNFKSTVYEWLVVAGARAQFKGSGTINGAGNYGFMLTAIDGQTAGGGGSDRFRMKIWIINADDTVGATIYDNQMGAGVDDAPTTGLGGGSIQIHSK